MLISPPRKRRDFLGVFVISGSSSVHRGEPNGCGGMIEVIGSQRLRWEFGFLSATSEKTSRGSRVSHLSSPSLFKKGNELFYGSCRKRSAC
jgi:hypothetical protein